MTTVNCIQPLEWLGDKLKILDQTLLPGETVFLVAHNATEVGQSIKDMRIRGAPAIGIAGAYGAALGALNIQSTNIQEFLDRFHQVIASLASTRPTAVNLAWALRRVEQATAKGKDVTQMKALAVDEASNIQRDEEQATESLSRFGADLVPELSTVLTHCNAGALATCGYGTALGVIRVANQRGKVKRVIADETRPLLQGARLTCWELTREGIPVTLIADSAAGHFLSRGEVDCVIVGADRIAGNGDTANKIGTYSLAVLASENGVPFFVAAPISTVDLALSSGSQIPIEERGTDEVTHIAGKRVAAQGVSVANPAFDVTPHQYITAIITERGIARPPYSRSLARLVEMR